MKTPVLQRVMLAKNGNIGVHLSSDEVVELVEAIGELLEGVIWLKQRKDKGKWITNNTNQSYAVRRS